MALSIHSELARVFQHDAERLLHQYEWPPVEPTAEEQAEAERLMAMSEEAHRRGQQEERKLTVTTLACGCIVRWRMRNGQPKWGRLTYCQGTYHQSERTLAEEWKAALANQSATEITR